MRPLPRPVSDGMHRAADGTGKAAGGAAASARSAASHVAVGARTAKQAILRLVGEIDVTTQLHYRAEADELLLDDEITGLTVDLSGATLIDSSALGLLVHLKMLARENALSLVLRAVPPSVHKLLRLTQLDRIFDIEPAERGAGRPDDADSE